MTPVLLIPMGMIPPEILSALVPAISVAFGCSCLIGAPMAVPAHTLDVGRRQSRADALVAAIEPQVERHVLALIDADIYVPGMNFLFGLADPPQRRAVVALPRLRSEWYGGKPDQGLFVRRVSKEAIHELGHTYGLGHCTDRRCVMAFSNSLLDTDFKNAGFCPACRQQLLASSR